MIARLVAALAVMGLVACTASEGCARSGTCPCTNCPNALFSEPDSGSSVDVPQGYRVDVTLSETATGAVQSGTLAVTDDNVLLVQEASYGHAMQFVTGRPGHARVTVAGTSFAVDVVVHRWPPGGDNVLNPYNPVTVNARVGDEFGILFYTSDRVPTTVVSGDNGTVQVLDTFTAPGRGTGAHFGVFRAVGRGTTNVTVTAGEAKLYPIKVQVASG
jgi:hypothetical protein